MTKAVRRIFIISLTLVMSLGILCACNKDNEDKQQLFALEKAYEKGIISVEDLQEIAYYLNNEIAYPEPLDIEVAQKIKEAKAKGYREQGIEQAVAEGISIEGYNGKYHGCYVVWLLDEYSPRIMEPLYYDRYVSVGGVELHYQLVAFAHVWVEK